MLELPFRFPSGLTVGNRIAKAAMTERMADPAGLPGDAHVRLFRRLAEGGAGLLVTGNVIVDGQHLEAFGNAILEDESAVPAFQHWASVGHQTGAAIIVQLNHPGRQAMRSVTDEPVAPSAVALPNKRYFATPRALTEAEIEALIGRFARSARLAEMAGFAGVEIHAAHGYLLSQFLSPNVNQRTDRWGGSVAGRARIVIAILDAVRRAVSSSFAVGVKVNAGDFVKGGLAPEDALETLRLLDRPDLDFIEISGGTFERPASFGYGVAESTRRREGYFLELARRAREVTRAPLILTGGLRSRAGMESALRDGACDLVGLARPLALEPDLPRRLLDGVADEARPAQLELPRGRIAPLAELSWYRSQLERIASGREPALGASAWWALIRTLVRDRVQGWRRRRHLRRSQLQESQS